MHAQPQTHYNNRGQWRRASMAPRPYKPGQSQAATANTTESVSKAICIDTTRFSEEAQTKFKTEAQSYLNSGKRHLRLKPSTFILEVQRATDDYYEVKASADALRGLFLLSTQNATQNDAAPVTLDIVAGEADMKAMSTMLVKDLDLPHVAMEFLLAHVRPHNDVSRRVEPLVNLCKADKNAEVATMLLRHPQVRPALGRYKAQDLAVIAFEADPAGCLDIAQTHGLLELSGKDYVPVLVNSGDEDAKSFALRHVRQQLSSTSAYYTSNKQWTTLLLDAGEPHLAIRQSTRETGVKPADFLVDLYNKADLNIVRNHVINTATTKAQSRWEKDSMDPQRLKDQVKLLWEAAQASVTELDPSDPAAGVDASPLVKFEEFVQGLGSDYAETIVQHCNEEEDVFAQFLVRHAIKSPRRVHLAQDLARQGRVSLACRVMDAQQPTTRQFHQDQLRFVTIALTQTEHCAVSYRSKPAVLQGKHLAAMTTFIAANLSDGELKLPSANHTEHDPLVPHYLHLAQQLEMHPSFKKAVVSNLIADSFHGNGTDKFNQAVELAKTFPDQKDQAEFAEAFLSAAERHDNYSGFNGDSTPYFQISFDFVKGLADDVKTSCFNNHVSTFARTRRLPYAINAIFEGEQRVAVITEQQELLRSNKHYAMLREASNLSGLSTQEFISHLYAASLSAHSTEFAVARVTESVSAYTMEVCTSDELVPLFNHLRQAHSSEHAQRAAVQLIPHMPIAARIVNAHHLGEAARARVETDAIRENRLQTAEGFIERGEYERAKQIAKPLRSSDPDQYRQFKVYCDEHAQSRIQDGRPEDAQAICRAIFKGNGAGNINRTTRVRLLAAVRLAQTESH